MRSLKKSRLSAANSAYRLQSKIAPLRTRLTIIDVESNIHEYVKGHIPGAMYVNEGLFRVHGRRIPTDWIPQQAAQVLRRTHCQSRGLQAHHLRGYGDDVSVPCLLWIRDAQIWKGSNCKHVRFPDSYDLPNSACSDMQIGDTHHIR